MALTNAQLIRLASMTGEAHRSVEDRIVDDFRLQEIADEVALLKDDSGLAPVDSGYSPTYDLYRAAAAVWSEKAARVAEGYNVKVEGASFNRSEVYEHYMEQAARFAGMAASLTMNTTPELDQ